MLNISAGSYVILFLIHVWITSSFNKITVYHVLHNATIQSLASCSPDLLLTWFLSSCSLCIKVARRERHHSRHNAIPPFPARYNIHEGDAITTCYSPRYNPEQEHCTFSSDELYKHDVRARTQSYGTVKRTDFSS